MASSRNGSDRAVRDRQTKRRTQEERRAETRARLLDASIRLLLEKGYSRFRIADAAAIAGVSRGGQTHHFATKNDLIKAAIEKLFGGELDHVRIEASSAGDENLLERAAAHIDEFLESELYQVSLKMLISAGETEHLASGIREIFARHREPIERAWIDRISGAGADPQQAEDVFWLLSNVPRGLAVERHVGGDPGDNQGLREFTVRLLTDYLAKPLANGADVAAG